MTDLKTGSLVVVGVGINISHTTLEAKAYIEQADKVFYLVSSPVAAEWIKQLNSTSESLYSLYSVGKERLETYQEMANVILNAVQEGLNVCAVFYGHPGIFVDPSHRVIKQARLKGYKAVMLPGVSAEDCLFADLGVDPARFGCQTFEATDFIVHNRQFDSNSLLILWQIGVVGDLTYQKGYELKQGLNIVLEKLLPEYGQEHSVTLYEASSFPIYQSKIISFPLIDLLNIEVCAISTLFIPPKGQTPPDLQILQRLGLSAV
jgi:precorrin-6B methylase 1